MASVSDKVTQASPRERLLETAIRMLAERGPEALQARRLAAEVGMSTMAVYTHFGGMPQLIQEMAREGFVRFGRRLEEAPRGDDPVADLVSLGLAYRAHALENPELYRLMFGVTPLAGTRHARADLTVAPGAPGAPGSPVSGDLPEGQAAFDQLVAAVTRIAGSGRARDEEDPVHVAAQMWSAVHGYVLLEMAGYFGDGERGVEHILLPMAIKLAVGAGTLPEAAEQAAERAAERAPEQVADRAVGRAAGQAAERAVGRAAEQVGERTDERATEQAGEHAALRAAEQVAERADERAAEQTGERADERAAAQAVERAAGRAAEQAGERAGERAAGQAAERAAEQAVGPAGKGRRP